MKLQLINGMIKIIGYNCFYKRVKIGKNSRALSGLDLYAEGNSKIEIQKNFYGRKNITIRAIDNGQVHIGENVFLNDGVSITCMSNISIGNDVRMGQNVLIYDHDHNYKGNDLIEKQGMSIAPVIIKDNVWIGSGVIILRGAVIESGSVIAAGTVVKGNVPENSLVYNEKSMVIRDKHSLLKDKNYER